MRADEAAADGGSVGLVPNALRPIHDGSLSSISVSFSSSRPSRQPCRSAASVPAGTRARDGVRPRSGQLKRDRFGARRPDRRVTPGRDYLTRYKGNYVTVDTPRSSRSGPVGPHRLCEPRTLHQLRHSRLTHLAEAGVQLPILMAKSRHTSLISLAVYAQPHLRRRRRRHRGTRPRPPALTPSHSRATSPDASRASHGLLRSPSTRRPSSATTPTPSSSSSPNSARRSTPPRRST